MRLFQEEKKHSGLKLCTALRELFPNYFLASFLIIVGCKKRAQIELHVRHWQLGSRLPTTVGGGAKSLRGSHRLGVERNLRASPFNEVISNDSTLSQIHLVGQYN